MNVMKKIPVVLLILLLTAAEKAAWKSDPYEQFLDLTGRGDSHA